MKEITPRQLKQKLDVGEIVQIIDIREFHEVDSGDMGGVHIPMAEVLNRYEEIRRDCCVVIHCRSGARARAIVYALQTQKGFDNLYYLKGGIEGWASDIDPKIEVY